jgi:hypothetical protein
MRASDRLKKATFVAAPSNDSKLFRELNANETSHSQAVRKKATTIAAIRNADLNDKKVQRAFVVGMMGMARKGGENINLSRGGTSKSSTNKADATASAAAIGLSKCLATVNNPASEATILQNLSANDIKRAPPASITLPPPREMTANGIAVGATSGALELPFESSETPQELLPDESSDDECINKRKRNADGGE